MGKEALRHRLPKLIKATDIRRCSIGLGQNKKEQQARTESSGTDWDKKNTNHSP